MKTNWINKKRVTMMTSEGMISVYLPNCDSNGKPINESKLNYWQSQFRLFFCKYFGGYTESHKNGAYVVDRAIIVQEQTLLIEGYDFKTRKSKNVEQKFQFLCFQFATDCSQQCVLYTKNGIAYLIFPENKQ